MSEAKHTPWVAIAAKDRDLSLHSRPIFEDGLWHIFEDPDLSGKGYRLPVAVVDAGDDHSPEFRKQAEFRARLIAAAPDLLAACEAALLHHLGEHSELADQLRAAIKAAKGEK